MNNFIFKLLDALGVIFYRLKIAPFVLMQKVSEIGAKGDFNKSLEFNSELYSRLNKDDRKIYTLDLIIRRNKAHKDGL